MLSFPVQHGAGKVGLQLTAKLLTRSSAAHVLLSAGKFANIPETQRENFYRNFPGLMLACSFHHHVHQEEKAPRGDLRSSLIEDTAQRPKPYIDINVITTVEPRKTIVRGTKLGSDGSLTWLLDEFDTMSVTRSNSLRRGSPPVQLRRDSSSMSRGQENGDPYQRHYSHPDRLDRDPARLEHYGADPRLAARPTQRDEGIQSRPQQQPRGQEPSRAHKDRAGPGPPPSPHRDRGPRKEQVWREPSDQRPKSSYTARDGSPQSPRDKRPLSGPNIHTPNLPVTDGGMKTAQQATRPFNTYPRSDSEGGRSPTGQPVRHHESSPQNGPSSAPPESPPAPSCPLTDRTPITPPTPA
ncbi:hypothetical protein OJAV_G00133390 [Oryzias javanicus]|uniref:Uncharacterized protein n=1 Tax=Oryzias javanicus TaxID=123683 RepID=A0A3S2M0B8_ORYJA|nr:hypothetical protein OJAV_G00133390 [Oryzias javanicus]